jgi:AraC family transcriptional regulator
MLEVAMTTTEQDYQQRMLRVLVHIQQHLDEALPLEDLAAVAHFSPYHFHRIFRGMVGESVHKHVRRLRLERAAVRLKGSAEPITQIAFEAGFESHEAFTRTFRSMFDLSPTQFREQNKPVPYPPSASGVHYAPDGQVESFNPLTAGGRQMEVTIEYLKPLRVAFMRHTGPYHEVGNVWQKFMGWAGMRGLLGPNMQCFGLCHDDPEVTPPDKIRYDACLVVGDGVQAEGEVGIQETPAGDYARTTHHGPYEKLSETYGLLCGQWLPGAGRELRSGPTMEFYRNNPMDTPPEQLVTDIFMPLEPK